MTTPSPTGLDMLVDAMHAFYLATNKEARVVCLPDTRLRDMNPDWSWHDTVLGMRIVWNSPDFLLAGLVQYRDVSIDLAREVCTLYYYYGVNHPDFVFAQADDAWTRVTG